MSGAHAIRQYRERNGLTQHALAERLGVTAATISRYEQGKREPRGKRLKLLAEAIGVPIADILEPAPEAAQ